MMSETTKRILLVVLLIVFAVLVVWRFGLLGGGGNDNSTPSQNQQSMGSQLRSASDVAGTSAVNVLPNRIPGVRPRPVPYDPFENAN